MPSGSPGPTPTPGAITCSSGPASRSRSTTGSTRAPGRPSRWAAIADGKGGTPTLKLMSWTIPVRYLRIWMTESSNTCDTHGRAGQAQLRGIRDQRTLCRDRVGRWTVHRRRQASAEPAADHHVAVVGGSVARRVRSRLRPRRPDRFRLLLQQRRDARPCRR